MVQNQEKNRVELIANLACMEKESGDAIEFSGDNAAEQFMDWLIAEKVDGWRIIYAHNFSGFDSYPIIHYFYGWSMLPQLLLRGQKCLQLVYSPCKLIFRCSYNFFNFPLADFTKGFGLKSSKGYFPFLLNTNEGENYEGDFPDIDYFDPKSMSPAKEAKLRKWWEQKMEKYQKTGKSYNLMAKMKKYCRNDVKLLWEGCESYRAQAVEYMGLDPLVTAVTGAQGINQAYRMKFMPPDSIVIVLDHGLLPQTQYSAIACTWLEWLMHSEAKAGNAISIKYALNGGEQKIENYRVDGYLETAQPLVANYAGACGKIVFEFYGCLWHGHECQDREKREPFTHRTMEE